MMVYVVCSVVNGTHPVVHVDVRHGVDDELLIVGLAVVAACATRQVAKDGDVLFLKNRSKFFPLLL